MSTAQPVPPHSYQHECQLSPPMDFRAPQRPLQAPWKWNEQSLALCLKYSPAIWKGVPWDLLIWCGPHGHSPRHRLSLLQYFVSSWSKQDSSFSFERAVKEAWRDGRNNQRNPESQKAKREKERDWEGERCKKELSQQSREQVVCHLPLSIKRLCGKGDMTDNISKEMNCRIKILTLLCQICRWLLYSSLQLLSVKEMLFRSSRHRITGKSNSFSERCLPEVAEGFLNIPQASSNNVTHSV